MSVGSLAENATTIRWEDTLVGVSYMLSTLACFIPYVIVLKAITSDKELMKLPSYRIIVHLGVRDIMLLCVHAISGPFTIFQTTLHPYVDKVVGATATCSYVPYALLTLVLSTNRLIQLCFSHHVDVIFSRRATTIWIAGCHIIGFMFFVCLVSPWASMIYYPDWYSWDYDHNRPFSWLVQRFAMIIEISVIPLSGIQYLVVVVYLIVKRRQFRELSNYEQEKRILIQAVILTVYCTILNVTWHNYSLFLPDTKWAYMALNFMWIYNSGINPVIYLILNKTIKDRVKILSNRGSVAVAMISVRRLPSPTILQDQTRIHRSNSIAPSFVAENE